MSVTNSTVVRRPAIKHALAVDAAAILLGAVLVWGAICAIGWTVTHPLQDAGFQNWEGGVDRYFAGHRTTFWNSVTKVASLVGDTPVIIGVAAIAFFALRPITGGWRDSLRLMVAMLGEVVIFTTTTVVVGRPRPTVKHLDGAPPTSSYPSGHTAASTTLYGLLAIVVFSLTRSAVLRVLAVAVVVVVVSSIGLSRLYRGMHFPTDIGGGVLLGILWLTVVVAVFASHRYRVEQSLPIEQAGS